MPERDAFGNELPAGNAGPGSGEPEASGAFGGPVGPEVQQDVESAPAAHPPAAPPREARGARAPRARPTPGGSVVPRAVGGCLSFVAIVFVVGGCALSSLVGSIGEGVDTFRSVSTELSRTAPVPPAGAAPEQRADPPRGLERGSLLRRAAFTRAMTRLRGAASAARARCGWPRIDSTPSS